MIEQQGLVIAVSGETASVRLGGKSACASCDAGKGCGAGVFGRLLRRKPLDMELHNAAGARIGQAVVVGLPESLFLQLVFRFYLFPLLSGLAGAAIGHYVSFRLQVGSAGADGLAMIGAVFAAAIVLAWNRRRNGKARELPQEFSVHLLRLVESEVTEQCGAVNEI